MDSQSNATVPVSEPTSRVEATSEASSGTVSGTSLSSVQANWKFRELSETGVSRLWSSNAWASGTWADRFGICLSGLCVIHCMLTPVLFLLLPALQALPFVRNWFTALGMTGAESMEGHDAHMSFHHVMLIFVPLLAVLAFIPGFLRHRSTQIFQWAIPGIVAIVLGAILFEEQLWLESLFSILGSALLIRAHLINRNLCACCGVGHGRVVPKAKPMLMKGRFVQGKKP